jgi:hypothetical protein
MAAMFLPPLSGKSLGRSFCSELTVCQEIFEETPEEKKKVYILEGKYIIFQIFDIEALFEFLPSLAMGGNSAPCHM